MIAFVYVFWLCLCRTQIGRQRGNTVREPWPCSPIIFGSSGSRFSLCYVSVYLFFVSQSLYHCFLWNQLFTLAAITSACTRAHTCPRKHRCVSQPIHSCVLRVICIWSSVEEVDATIAASFNTSHLHSLTYKYVSCASRRRWEKQISGQVQVRHTVLPPHCHILAARR